MNIKDKIDEFNKKEIIAKLGGGRDQIDKQHKLGKLTARERVELLLDPNSFLEIGLFVTHQCHDFGMDQRRIWGDGVVTGSGMIEGRPVHLYAQDFTVFGGSVGEYHAKKIASLLDSAIDKMTPIIAMNDSGGARIQEGPHHYAAIYYRNYLASGIVPQLALIIGPCSGGAAISASLADFVIVVSDLSRMFISGPEVVKALTGENVSPQELGEAKVHMEKTGIAHFIAMSEAECFEKARLLLSFLPSNFREEPPRITTDDDLDRETEIENIFENSNNLYDMRGIICTILDNGKFLEVQESFAKNMIIGFGRINGSSIGIVANQPIILNGMVDLNAADKAARFIRFCDSFNIPMLNLVDCPGYFAGKDQEHSGLIRHVAKMAYAYGEATVPRIAIAVGKVYGAGISGMGMSKAYGTDLTIAYPFAEIAAMRPEAAANIIFREEISQSSNPETIGNKKIQEYYEKYANPYVAAERGWIDMVINPKDTRRILIKALNNLKTKARDFPKKRHGTIPL